MSMSTELKSCHEEKPDSEVGERYIAEEITSREPTEHKTAQDHVRDGGQGRPSLAAQHFCSGTQLVVTNALGVSALLARTTHSIN